MADTLIATVGASNADSYNTLAQLDLLFASDVGVPAGWSALSDSEKCRHARTATRWLEPRWIWSGWPTDLVTPQSLAWPRFGAYDASGRQFARDAIPTAIRLLHAHVVKLSVEGGLQTGALERGGAIASETVGPISTSYFEGAAGTPSYPFLDAIAGPLTSGSGLRLFSNGG